MKLLKQKKTNLDNHHNQRKKYHHNAENFAHRVHFQVKKSNLITPSRTTALAKHTEKENMHKESYFARSITNNSIQQDPLFINETVRNKTLKQRTSFHLRTNSDINFPLTVTFEERNVTCLCKLLAVKSWTNLHAGFGRVHNASRFAAGINNNSKCCTGCNHRVGPGSVLNVQ